MITNTFLSLAKFFNIFTMPPQKSRNKSKIVMSVLFIKYFLHFCLHFLLKKKNENQQN